MSDNKTLTSYMQVVPQTDAEKIATYMHMPQRKLAEMHVEALKHIPSMRGFFIATDPGTPPHTIWSVMKAASMKQCRYQPNTTGWFTHLIKTIDIYWELRKFGFASNEADQEAFDADNDVRAALSQYKFLKELEAIVQEY